MNTSIPDEVTPESWAKDFTPTIATRRTLLYLQCGGTFYASATYCTRRTTPLASFLCLYTKEGLGLVTYQGKEIPLTKGTIMIIDCRLPHTYRTGDTEHWVFNWFHFAGTAAEGYTEQLASLVQPATDECCIQAFTECFNYTKNYTPFTELSASGAIVRCILTLVEHSYRISKGKSPVTLPVIAEALNCIEEHCLTSLSLEDLAKQMKMDKYKLSHLFKEQVGYSPHEYLLFCRMNRAKTLLRTTDCTISSVADQCGFDSASYFISFFREREGVTPLAFRKQFTEQ
ncbi:MAG: AraC family transcriptional regulator [Treponema sp.]|nr:AraC family transcriptional regulator [Treponema sp.]